MRHYTLEYLFDGEPRTHVFELKQHQLRFTRQRCTCYSCTLGTEKIA